MTPVDEQNFQACRRQLVILTSRVQVLSTDVVVDGVTSISGSEGCHCPVQPVAAVFYGGFVHTVPYPQRGKEVGPQECEARAMLHQTLEQSFKVLLDG